MVLKVISGPQVKGHRAILILNTTNSTLLRRQLHIDMRRNPIAKLLSTRLN